MVHQSFYTFYNNTKMISPHNQSISNDSLLLSQSIVNEKPNKIVNAGNQKSNLQTPTKSKSQSSPINLSSSNQKENTSTMNGKVTKNSIQQQLAKNEQKSQPNSINKVPQNAPIQQRSTKDHDEIPIGKGSKFNYAQYPVKQADSQGIKNQKQTIQSDIQQLPLNRKMSSNDDIPIGGSKFKFTQFPDGENVQSKPKRIVKKTSKIEIKPQEIADIPKDLPKIDEIPVGRSNFNLSEYPQGQQQQSQVNEPNYPMNQKLKSKAVKLRLSGLQDLYTLLNENPNSEQINEIQIGKFLKQSNPACLQKILQCFLIWIDKKNWNDQDAKSAIENGLINGKPNTKKITIEILEKMFEDKQQTIEMIILTGFKSKIAKTIAGYISIVTQLLKSYGIKRMKYLKPYLSDIVRILNTEKLPSIKVEGVNLLKQGYKWLTKEAMQPSLMNLKQAIKKQVDAFWDSYDKQQVMQAPKDKSLNQGANKNKKKQKVDAYDICDAVDIFKKYPQKWTQSVLKADKWNQKVKLMQQFVKEASVPKITYSQKVDGGNRHIIQMIKRLINDSNFNVILWDLKIIAVLAKGIRRPLAPVIKMFFSQIISKFRDKKTQMIDETFNTLSEAMYCINIEQVIDDIKQGLNDKAPTMKVNLIKWISRYVSQRVQEKGQLTQKTKQAIKMLFVNFQKLLNDSTSQVRDCMAQTIGKMKLLINDEFFSTLQFKMSKNVASKIKDAKEKTRAETKFEPKNTLSQTGQFSPIDINQSKVQLAKTQKIIINNNNINEQVNVLNEINKLIPKLNDMNWNIRRDSAQAISKLLTQSQSKLNLSIIGQLMPILKVRINDTNKNVIKNFVHLLGLVFNQIPQRDTKHYAKMFIPSLLEGLSDKSQHNRKQIVLTLKQIGNSISMQHLLSMIGTYLEGDRDSRLQVLNFIYDHEQYLLKTDIKQYPKGIISCLCDKNKQIRNMSEKILEKIFQKIGVQNLRFLANNQRPAFAKDLNLLFDKLSKRDKTPTKSQIYSNKKIVSQPHIKNNQKIVRRQQYETRLDSSRISMNENYSPLTFVQQNQLFASQSILNRQRKKRLNNQERYPNLPEYITQAHEQYIRQQIFKFVNVEIANKMFSFNPTKVSQAITIFSKLAQKQSNSFRQLYDLFIKWIHLRLLAGSPSLMSLIDLLLNILNILEKKKSVLTDDQVCLVLEIIKNYLILAYINSARVSQSLYIVARITITLNSGEKVLNFILNYFIKDSSDAKFEIKNFYLGFFVKIVSTQLIEYFKNDTLMKVFKIKQLASHTGFIELLFKRFNPSILQTYGFKKPGNGQLDHNIQNKSISITQLNQTQQNKNSKQINTNNQQNKKNWPGNKTGANTNIQQSIVMQNKIQKNARMTNMSLSPRNSSISGPSYKQTIDISTFPKPEKNTTLGRHLLSLVPPKMPPQQALNYFNEIFIDEKTANQNSKFAKIIMGSLLISSIHLLKNRYSYSGQQIIYVLNLIQQAIKSKSMIKACSELYYPLTRFALTQLVYQDENKDQISQELKNRNSQIKQQAFTKVINSIMLRILENAPTQQITFILFDLLIMNIESQTVSQKMLSLITKCLTRVITNLTLVNPENLKDFLVRLNIYFNINKLDYMLEEFNPLANEKLKPQQSLIQAIKKKLAEFCTTFKSGIWHYYQKAIVQSNYADNHIKSFINFMKIPYSQKHLTSERNYPQNDDLKKINELLSKSKTFQQGIQLLKKFIEVNPDFTPVEYFQSLSYDQKFITMVIQALKGYSVIHRKTASNIENPQPQKSNEINLQDRLKQLRDKVEGTVNQVNKTNSPSNNTKNLNPKSNQNIDQEKEQRDLQIKRRLAEMKNKFKTKPH